MLTNLKLLALVAALMVLPPMMSTAHADASAEAAKLQEEAMQAWEAFKAYASAQKEEAVDAGQAMLERVNAELEALNEQAASVGGEASAKWQEHKPQLEAVRDDLQEKLAAFQASVAENYEDTKDAVGEAYRQSVDGIVDVKTELENQS